MSEHIKEHSAERAIWALLAALLECGRTPEEIRGALAIVASKILEESP